MNILIGGIRAPDGKGPIGGTQSWMDTIARFIDGRVDFWEPGRPITKKYDLGIFAHEGRVQTALPYCKKTILVTHGIVKEEKPLGGCDITLATSEEIRDHWGLDCPIIRQPIDTDFWSVSKRSRGSLCRFAYRHGETYSQRVSDALSMEYERIRDMNSVQIREALSRSGVCHATGRAALESMACGVPTLIYDHRAAYQPHLLDTRTLRESAATNYSGRGGIENPSFEQVFTATENIMKLIPGWRDYILVNHDAKRIAKEILCYSY